MMPAQPRIRMPDQLVVIIDDDAAVRSSLKFSLEIEGFTVRDYSNVNELLNESKLTEAGCLVVDYNLSEMNGLEMLHQLRDRQIAVPAILITSHPSAAVRQRAAEAGVPIIEKPLLGNALIEGIRNAFAP
jgi:two-component system, LuxR family, response regulator FixJ